METVFDGHCLRVAFPWLVWKKLCECCLCLFSICRSYHKVLSTYVVLQCLELLCCRWYICAYTQPPEERADNRVGSQNKFVDRRVHELVEKLPKYVCALIYCHEFRECVCECVYACASICSYICVYILNVASGFTLFAGCYTIKFLFPSSFLTHGTQRDLKIGRQGGGRGVDRSEGGAGRA